MRIGFDNEKYQRIQSEHIKERISQFDGKLYLELGGKLFDDHHASRVLPGFLPDSKLRMFQKISDSIEIVIVISAADIEKNKKRADLGITYDEDVLRLADWAQEKGIRLILDESFADFADEADNTFIRQDLLDRYRGLYVVKSISKSYGVPGLRLGVLASGDQDLIAALKKDVAIWNINSFAEFYMQIEEKYKKD